MTSRIVIRAKNYRKFSGILSGLSISIAVLLVAFIGQRLEEPFFVYALSSFIYSALALLYVFTFYGRVIEIDEKDNRSDFSPYWEIGTLFYYTGFWAIFSGLMFFTYSIGTGNTYNFPFLISIPFLIFAFFESGYEFYYEIFKQKGSNSVWIVGSILLILYIIILILAFLI